MAYQSSIKLTKVVERFELEVLNAGKNYDHCLVRADDINRPALQILGFFRLLCPPTGSRSSARWSGPT